MLGAWLKRYLESRRLSAFAVGLAIVLSLPSLGLGLAMDDWWQRGKMLGSSRWAIGSTGTFSLFDFADGSAAEHARFVQTGFMPWWTLPGLRISFFRPLSCLTHALDYALWPKTPALMHAQSILWYGALLVLVVIAYRRWLSPIAANVAILFYAIDPTHALPVGWLANRNAIIAATFALGALLVYDRRRHLLAALLLGFALLSGESALTILGFFVAHWLFIDRRPLGSLWPFAPVLLGWVLVWKLGHYGVAGSGLYCDPTRRPLAYATNVAWHVPVLLGDEVNAPSPDLWSFMSLGWRLANCGIALFWLAFTWWLAPRADKTTRFFALGSLLAVLPVAATEPAGRLLLVASFGLVGIVAQICTGPLERWPAKIFAGWSWLAHGLFALPLFIANTAGFWLVDHTIRAWGEGVPVDGSAVDKRLVLVNAPNTAFAYYFIVDPLEDGKAPPTNMLITSANRRDVTLTRTSETTIRVHEDAGFYHDGEELLFIEPGRGLRDGATVDQGDVLVTVRHLSAEGVPDEAEFAFRRPLAEGYVFRAWQGNALVPFELPPVGAQVSFPGRMPSFL